MADTLFDGVVRITSDVKDAVNPLKGLIATLGDVERIAERAYKAGQAIREAFMPDTTAGQLAGANLMNKLIGSDNPESALRTVQDRIQQIKAEFGGMQEQLQEGWAPNWVYALYNNSNLKNLQAEIGTLLTTETTLQMQSDKAREKRVEDTEKSILKIKKMYAQQGASELEQIQLDSDNSIESLRNQRDSFLNVAGLTPEQKQRIIDDYDDLFNQIDLARMEKEDKYWENRKIKLTEDANNIKDNMEKETRARNKALDQQFNRRRMQEDSIRREQEQNSLLQQILMSSRAAANAIRFQSNYQPGSGVVR